MLHDEVELIGIELLRVHLVNIINESAFIFDV